MESFICVFTAECRTAIIFVLVPQTVPQNNFHLETGYYQTTFLWQWTALWTKFELSMLQRNEDIDVLKFGSRKVWNAYLQYCFLIVFHLDTWCHFTHYYYYCYCYYHGMIWFRWCTIHLVLFSKLNIKQMTANVKNGAKKQQTVWWIS